MDVNTRDPNPTRKNSRKKPSIFLFCQHRNYGAVKRPTATLISRRLHATSNRYDSGMSGAARKKPAKTSSFLRRTQNADLSSAESGFIGPTGSPKRRLFASPVECICYPLKSWNISQCFMFRRFFLSESVNLPEMICLIYPRNVFESSVVSGIFIFRKTPDGIEANFVTNSLNMFFRLKHTYSSASTICDKILGYDRDKCLIASPKCRICKSLTETTTNLRQPFTGFRAFRCGNWLHETCTMYEDTPPVWKRPQKNVDYSEEEYKSW